MLKPDIDDLRYEVLATKRQNCELKTENQHLKVKIRKLVDELGKKSKQIMSLLDPKKFQGETVRKLLSQHGTSVIMALEEDNEKLKKQMIEKDVQIQKLQNELQTFRLYSDKSKIILSTNKFLDTAEAVVKIENLSESSSVVSSSPHRRAQNRSKSVTRDFRNKSASSRKICTPNKLSPQRKQSKSATDLGRDYRVLLNKNLKVIKECGSKRGNQAHQVKLSSTKTNAASVDSHVEIQQLQNYFLNVLSEVDYLKETVNRLQAKQTKTATESQSNVHKLSTEIRSLKAHGRKKSVETHRTHMKGDNVKCIKQPNPVELESESCGEEELSLPSTTVQSTQKTSNGMDAMVSVSVQTTKSFCAPAIFSDNEVNQIVKSSVKHESGIEVEFIN